MLLVVLLQAAAAVPAAADGEAGDPDQGRPPHSKVDGDLGVRLLEAPTSRADDPRARVYIVDHVNPGTAFTRRFQVASTSSNKLRVQMYAAAAELKGGKFVFAPGRTPSELTTWISLDHTKLDLKPHGRATVTTRIAVPKKASEGERYAVIWAEVSSAKPGPGGNVAQVHRVGIRTYLDVGPGGEPPSDFKIGQVIPQRTEDGVPQVVADVHNNGKRALDITGQLSLKDNNGSLSVGPFRTTGTLTLAPNQRGKVTAAVTEKDLPDREWKFQLTLKSGKITRTVSGTLTFPEERGAFGLPAALSEPLPLTLTLAGALAVAAILLTVTVVGLRRLRGRTARAALHRSM